MRAFKVFILVCVGAVVATTSGGPCEKIENFNRYGSIGTRRTCFMSSAAIDSKNFSITSDRDETVEALYAYDNYNLNYMPNNLGAKFPNLIGLRVNQCSIRGISKNNFKGLSHLRYLSFHTNRIEKIDDDTFDGIPSVEEINLSRNKIKKLNGRAFASLHKLSEVWLLKNECIDEFFEFADRIAEMPRIVTEKCGFIDPEPSSTNDHLK